MVSQNMTSEPAIFESFIPYLYKKVSIHYRIMSYYLLTKNRSIIKWKN